MVLEYDGCNWFCQRIICSTLSGKSISIRGIRSDQSNPGILEHQVNLMRLVEKLSNGFKLHISNDGTSVYYKPGILIGGKIEHDCGDERGIGYYAKVLVVLSPFCKNPVDAILHGVTNHYNNLDLSVDFIKHVLIPNMKHFGLDGVNLKILKRSFFSDKSGKVALCSPIIKNLGPIKMIDDGKVQKVRAVAYSCRVSGTVSRRLEVKLKEDLNVFVKDVHVYRDVSEDVKDKGSAPGYGLLLVAETSTGCLVAAESVAIPRQIPEQLVDQCCTKLLAQISQQGCVDTFCQGVMLLYMALVHESVSVIRLGQLSEYTIAYLRHMKNFFGVVFRVEEEPESDTLKLTCLGIGLNNLSRKTF